jgi:hypothetical protein
MQPSLKLELQDYLENAYRNPPIVTPVDGTRKVEVRFSKHRSFLLSGLNKTQK